MSSLTKEIITQEIKAGIEQAVTSARLLSIIDTDTYQQAVEVTKTLQEHIRGVEGIFRPHIERAHQAHKELLNDLKEQSGPAAVALEGLKGAMSRFTVQERARIEKERKAQEDELRRQREEDRLAEAARIEEKLKAEAEERRQKEEKRRAEEAEKRSESERAKVEAENARQAEEMRQKEEEARTAVVNAVLDAPIENIRVTAPAATPKIEGVSTRTQWKFEIVDASLIPSMFMMPNERAIGDYVRDQKERANIPGVRAYPDVRTIVR